MPSLFKELPVMTHLIFTQIYKIKTGTTPTFQMRKLRQRSNLPKVAHPGTHLGVKLALTLSPTSLKAVEFGGRRVKSREHWEDSG